VTTAGEVQAALLAPLVESYGPEVGPFVVLLDATSSNPFRNYAVPRPGAAPTSAEVRELGELFASRELRGRLEYVEPNELVTAALLAGGFTIERRLPLMALGVPTEPDPPSDIEICAAVDDDELLGAATVMCLAYDDTEAPEHGAARLRGTLNSGGYVGIAVDSATGRVVGAGVHSAATTTLGTPTTPRLCELAAVATLPDYRRRGIAESVSADIALHAVSIGAGVFLQAEGEAEARIYRRAGFEEIGSLVLVDGPELAS
jgi:ribosomal protein S18 acetylase RimI-like enzyme